MTKNNCKTQKIFCNNIPFVGNFILVKNNPVNPADYKTSIRTKDSKICT